MDTRLLNALETLKNSGQRVVIKTNSLYGSNTLTYAGTIQHIAPADNTFRIQRMEGGWQGDWIRMDLVQEIRSSTRSRSKRDLAKYGLYRVFWEVSPVALDADGVLDVGNTLRQLLAVA